MASASAAVIVPADLAEQSWGLVFVAELLAPDEMTVLASAYSECRYLPVLSPLRLELASAASVEAKAGLGDTGSFAGTLHRTHGLEGPVTITLAGLPSEYPAPKIEVPAGQAEFSLSVAFPYGLPPAELKNVQLVAETATPGGLLRSNAVGVEVRVVAGEKPPAEMPLAIFEDEEAFISQLSKGSGQISLEANEKYSGAASAKVTPDQRYNETVQGLGLKIRENPGPGEYRYLRFVWRKTGGQTICLQLNHDGAWGPGGGAKEGASFRYHAGSGGECYGASLALDDKIPAEFVVITRDLFTDFGEFTLSGLAFSPVDGDYALFDHLYLGRSPADFDLVAPK
jgi:hypothetical protein